MCWTQDSGLRAVQRTALSNIQTTKREYNRAMRHKCLEETQLVQFREQGLNNLCTQPAQLAIRKESDKRPDKARL